MDWKVERLLIFCYNIFNMCTLFSNFAGIDQKHVSSSIIKFYEDSFFYGCKNHEPKLKCLRYETGHNL